MLPELGRSICEIENRLEELQMANAIRMHGSGGASWR